MNLPRNVLWFEVLLYLSLTLDAVSVAFRLADGGTYTAVERATLDITVDGRRSSVKIDGVSENRMTPLTNPVTGDENDVRIVKSTGFIWLDGEIAESEKFQVELPEMSWDLANRHCVFSQFDYTNA